MISAEGSQTHRASLTNSAGCNVNGPMAIHPLLPYWPTPSGVRVSSCRNPARHTAAKPNLRYSETGTIEHIAPTTRPMAQNATWLIELRNGDLPAAELENTMIRPKQLNPITAMRKPW